MRENSRLRPQGENGLGRFNIWQGECLRLAVYADFGWGFCSEAAREALSGAREVLLQGSFYEVSLALVGVASLA